MMAHLALLATLVASSAQAHDGPKNPETMADNLTEHLGVSAEDADAIVAILQTARGEVEGIREDAKELAAALKAAKDAGDEKAMKRAMTDLRKLRSRAEDAREDAREDIFDRLTIEQQAQWTLIHLRKRAKRVHALESLRTLKLQEAL